MSTDADAKKNPINLAKYSSHAYPATQVMQNHVVLVSDMIVKKKKEVDTSDSREARRLSENFGFWQFHIV